MDITDFGGCSPYTHHSTLKFGWNDTRRGIGHGCVRKFTHKIILAGRYTLAVKMSNFTVWRHIWRKNWPTCAVLTCNSAGLRTVISSHLSHRELLSSLRESHSFLSLPTDTTMSVRSFANSLRVYNLQHPILAIHSANEHRIIYSFWNTTSYSTFYAFFLLFG